MLRALQGETYAGATSIHLEAHGSDAGRGGRDVVVQLLLARADPGKPCGVLGLLPGQHAILQVPGPHRLSVHSAYMPSTHTLSVLPERHNKFPSCRSCTDRTWNLHLIKLAVNTLDAS